MMKFIKLSSVIINTNNIKKITLQPNKYYIHFTNNKVDGWFIFGGGTIDSIDDDIEICKTKSPQDYNSISDWISKLN
jgi:hypothetical protein